MKEIIIRYKTCKEFMQSKEYGDYSRMQVLIDGNPIDKLELFSITVNPNDAEPVYTIKQKMTYPEEKEYHSPN